MPRSANRSEGQEPSAGGSNKQQGAGISSISTAGAWGEHLSTEITLTVPVHPGKFCLVHMRERSHELSAKLWGQLTAELDMRWNFSLRNNETFLNMQ